MAINLAGRTPLEIHRFVLNARGHNPSVADESVREPLEIQLRYQSPRLDYENRNLLARLPFTSTVPACIRGYSRIPSAISLPALSRNVPDLITFRIAAYECRSKILK